MDNDTWEAVRKRTWRDRRQSQRTARRRIRPPTTAVAGTISSLPIRRRRCLSTHRACRGLQLGGEKRALVRCSPTIHACQEGTGAPLRGRRDGRGFAACSTKYDLALSLAIWDGAKLWDCFVLTELETEAVPPAGRSHSFASGGKVGRLFRFGGRIRSDGGDLRSFCPFRVGFGG